MHKFAEETIEKRNKVRLKDMIDFEKDAVNI